MPKICTSRGGAIAAAFAAAALIGFILAGTFNVAYQRAAVLPETVIGGAIDTAPVWSSYVLPSWRELARQHERLNKLPAGLLEATCDLESRPTTLNPNRSTAVSPAGAVGVCQVMPVTALWLLGNAEPDDADVVRMTKLLEVDEVNVMFSGWYMDVCYRRWRGKVARALYCYNTGHNARRPRMTDYVREIISILRDLNNTNRKSA